LTTWYIEVQPSEKISQGDIFINCPIFTPRPKMIFFEGESGIYWDIESLDTDIETANIVVLNQACDLQNRPPEQLIVAPINDILTMPLKENTNRWSFIKEVYSGKRPNYSLIGDYKKEGSENLHMNYQIVDFSNVTILPYVLLDEYRVKIGKRLRLNTPHRELLSQQFGNFYSRIGLPNEDYIREETLKQIVKGTQIKS
jgi:hypothetical protein